VLSHSRVSVAPEAVLIQPPSAFRADEYQRSPLPLRRVLRSQVAAFSACGGVPRVLLCENLRSAVLERQGDAIRFHPTLLELSAHYRFEPRPL
jgi:transposase